MKFILSVALIVAIVGFINAQSPPNFQVCTAYVNSTEAAFCAPHVSYTILNNTDYTSVNTAARSVYDYALARITNATDVCRAAVAAYACHSKISRCSRTGLYVRVFQGTCNTVATACGISDFPQNFTVTGTLGCIANQLNSVEGQNAICIPSQQVAVGASCQNIFANDITTPSPVQYSVCPIVAACNVTATAPTCVRPNNVGDVCTSSAGCISNPLSGGVIGGVGSTLQCISGICTYSGKRENQACVSNGECLSNNCTAGTCRVSDLNGPCTTSLGCANFLYCDTRNSTCYSAAQGGESCGFLQPNWDLVPCVSGFSCVRPNVNATTSTCVPLANLNQACSVASGVVQDAPACNPLSVNGPVSCQDGVCALTYKTLGQACSASVQCDPRYTCNYFNSTSGVCAEPNTVACATTASNCNMFQRCNCGADVTQTGTCAVDTTNPRVACATRYLAVATCQQNKCAGAPFVAYEANTCVTSNCLTELNAYYCCAKNTVGANFVAPIGMPAEPCVTPTPTPGPTSPTGTGTPVPIQSSKRSSASTVAVNLIALILAVVAFL